MIHDYDFPVIVMERQMSGATTAGLLTGLPVNASASSPDITVGSNLLLRMSHATTLSAPIDQPARSLQ